MLQGFNNLLCERLNALLVNLRLDVKDRYLIQLSPFTIQRNGEVRFRPVKLKNTVNRTGLRIDVLDADIIRVDGDAGFFKRIGQRQQRVRQEHARLFPTGISRFGNPVLRIERRGCRERPPHWFIG